MTESAQSHHPYPDDAIAEPFVLLHSFAHTCRVEYSVPSHCQNLDKYSALRLHIRIGLLRPLNNRVHRQTTVRGLSTRSFSIKSTKSDCEQRSLLLVPKLRAMSSLCWRGYDAPVHRQVQRKILHLLAV